VTVIAPASRSAAFTTGDNAVYSMAHLKSNRAVWQQRNRWLQSFTLRGWPWFPFLTASPVFCIDFRNIRRYQRNSCSSSPMLCWLSPGLPTSF
jgi:hypothetical protein